MTSFNWMQSFVLCWLLFWKCRILIYLDSSVPKPYLKTPHPLHGILYCHILVEHSFKSCLRGCSCGIWGRIMHCPHSWYVDHSYYPYPFSISPMPSIYLRFLQPSSIYHFVCFQPFLILDGFLFSYEKVIEFYRFFYIHALKELWSSLKSHKHQIFIHLLLNILH